MFSKYVLSNIFKENTQYTFSCMAYRGEDNNNGIQAKFNYSDGTETHINIPSNASATLESITSSENKTVVSFEIVYIRAREIHIKDMILSAGFATEYEPYTETSQLFVLDEPLRGIGDVKDKFRLVNNTLEITRCIGRVVLDSTIGGYNSSSNWYYYDINNLKAGSTIVMSNYFEYKSYNIFNGTDKPNGICPRPQG